MHDKYSISIGSEIFQNEDKALKSNTKLTRTVIFVFSLLLQRSLLVVVAIILRGGIATFGCIVSFILRALRWCRWCAIRFIVGEYQFLIVVDFIAVSPTLLFHNFIHSLQFLLFDDACEGWNVRKRKIQFHFIRNSR